MLNINPMRKFSLSCLMRRIEKSSGNRSLLSGLPPLMKLLFFSGVLSLLLHANVEAQNSVVELGNGHLIHSSHVRTGDGGILTVSAWTGNLRILFVKTDSLYNLQWSFAIPWPGNYNASFDSFDMCALSSGSCVVLLRGSPMLLKISASGVVEWSNYYSDTLGVHVFNDITIDSYDRILAAGYQTFSSSSYQGVIAVLDTNGIVLRVTNYTNSSLFESIVKTTDGGFTVAGSAPQLTLMHCDSSGVIIWSTKHNVASTFGLHITEIIHGSDNSFVLTGCSIGQGIALKFDSAGMFLWASNYYYYQTTTQYNGLVETTNAYVICGAVSPSLNCGMNGLILALDKSSGMEIWHSTFGYLPQNAHNSYFNSIEKTTTGFLLGGFSNILQTPVSTKNAVLVFADSSGVIPCYNSGLPLNQSASIIVSPVAGSITVETGTAHVNAWNAAPYILPVISGRGCAVGLPEESSELGILLFPNPATDFLQIKNTLMSGCVEIISSNGQSVYFGQLNVGDNIIDISTFNSGIYFLSITLDDGSRQNDKIIIN